MSNHIEKQGAKFQTQGTQIIRTYREKTKIEDVFKNVKSFLKIRPFFVNKDKSTGKIIRKSVELPKCTRKLLQQIGMELIAVETWLIA